MAKPNFTINNNLEHTYAYITTRQSSIGIDKDYDYAGSDLGVLGYICYGGNFVALLFTLIVQRISYFETN